VRSGTGRRKWSGSRGQKNGRGDGELLVKVHATMVNRTPAATGERWPRRAVALPSGAGHHGEMATAQASCRVQACRGAVSARRLIPRSRFRAVIASPQIKTTGTT
jgi:hypothetical protein